MELGRVAGQSGDWKYINPSALKFDGQPCMAIETNLTEISVDLQYCYCHLLSSFSLFLVWRVKMATRRSLGLGGLG